MSQKIAFIRKTMFPLTSIQLQQEIQKLFPENKVVLFDITEMIKDRKDILVRNSLSTVLKYGVSILSHRRKFKESFFRTDYMYQKVKELMTNCLDRDDYLFSIQMQSLFDASKTGLKHFIYTDHTHLANLDYPDFKRSKLYPQWWIALEKKIYANASVVFTRSQNISLSLVNRYDCSSNKVVCAFAGSNINVGERQVEKEYTNKHILFVGKDWERKGGPDLIEAFKNVLKVYPTAQLTIVGCSPHIKVPNCHIVGRIPLEFVMPYYERASIFCLPTKMEPFGIAFLEAMSYKLPVIGTNIGAIPDFIVDNQNGYLVSPGDVDGLTQALTRLLDSPRRCKEFGQKGSNIVKEKYTWENTGNVMKYHILSAL